ncbi:hypothetical protein ACFW2V_13350 [Streptomyces sp. NPDC058947]|uniref:hypothetical protein n=1 Tax=Streptomyces sp. NPDC058947 TaxID=3346675 RepID=UPI0036A73B40
MNNIKGRSILTILAGFIALMTFNPPADAAPMRAAVKSVCDTGYRGMPEYDRKCLKTGTFRDGAMLWLGDGTREGAAQRRAVCTAAVKSGIRIAVREFVFDVAYDRFRNHNAVITYATVTATADCLSMGYKIKK